MTSAVLFAFAVWCFVPAPARNRHRTPSVPRRRTPRIPVAVLAGGLAAIATMILFGLPFGALFALVAAPVAHRAVGSLETGAARARAARLHAQLPASLDLMVAALAAGRPPAMVFALVGEVIPDPLGARLLAVGQRLASSDPNAVWLSLADDPVLAPVARAFRRAADSGMPIAQIVAGVSDEVRRDHLARRRERSRGVAVRTAAPLGLCFLPAFFLIGVAPTIVATMGTFTA